MCQDSNFSRDVTVVDGNGEERRIHGQLLLLLFPALHGVDQFDQVILAGGDAEVLDVFTAFSQNVSEFFPLRSIGKTFPYLESLGVTRRQISADSPPCSQETVNPPSLPGSPTVRCPSPGMLEVLRETGYTEQDIQEYACAGAVTKAVSPMSPSHLPADCLSPSPSSTALSPHSSSQNPAVSPPSNRGTKRPYEPEVV